MDEPQYDLGALAHKLEVTLAKLDELPAVQAERRRLDDMVNHHNAVVAEWSNEIARLSEAIGRMDPQDPRHRHQPAPHPHRELDSIPMLETGLRLVKDQIAAMQQTPVAEHPHPALATGAALNELAAVAGAQVQTLEDRIAEVDGAAGRELRKVYARLEEVAGQVGPHPHLEIINQIDQLKHEVAEMQVTLQDQITALTERITDTQSLVAGLGHQMAALAEQTHEQLEAMRQAIGGQERSIAAATLAAQVATETGESLLGRIVNLETLKADWEHNHDVTRDIAEPGRRHVHEMVVKERIGGRTVLRCDLPGCNAEWAETR